MMATKEKRVPVMVDESVYDTFKNYSEKSGATISYLIREALTEWSKTVIPARSEGLDEAKAKVIAQAAAAGRVN